MREETRTIYHCEYCKKYLMNKSSMLRHESTCKNNPDIKLKCRDCCFSTVLEKEDFVKMVDWKELGKKEYTLNGHGKEEITISWSFHYCLKYEKKMMPPKALNGVYGIILNETENTIIMPTENEGCAVFKQYKAEEKHKNRLADEEYQCYDTMGININDLLNVENDNNKPENSCPF